MTISSVPIRRDSFRRRPACSPSPRPLPQLLFRIPRFVCTLPQCVRLCALAYLCIYLCLLLFSASCSPSLLYDPGRSPHPAEPRPAVYLLCVAVNIEFFLSFGCCRIITDNLRFIMPRAGCVRIQQN